jgi:hypothetical protein
MYTLQGKPDTHDTYDFCASSRTPLVRFLRAVLVRGNLSWVINSVGQSHYPWEKETPDYIPSMSTAQSAGLHLVSLLLTTIEAVEKAKHPLINKVHRFTGPISPACDQYVQYLLTEANSSVLNRHKRGLQSWRCRLATSHSLTFPADDTSHST